MRLRVGNRVTLRAVYRENGKPTNPVDPRAEVAIGGDDRTLTVENGGLTHEGVGAFRAVVTVDRGPTMTVRFCHGADGESFHEQSWGVDDQDPIEPPAARPSRVDDGDPGEAQRVAELRARVRRELDAEDEEFGEHATSRRDAGDRLRAAWDKRT